MTQLEKCYGKIEDNKIDGINKIYQLLSQIQTEIVKNRIPLKLEVFTDYRYEPLTEDNKRYFRDHSNIFAGLFRFN